MLMSFANSNKFCNSLFIFKSLCNILLEYQHIANNGDVKNCQLAAAWIFSVVSVISRICRVLKYAGTVPDISERNSLR